MPTRMSEATRAKAQEARSSAKSVKQLLKHLGAWWPATQTTKIEKRLEEMPESCRRTYAKAMMGKSITAAVKAECCMCMGWEDFRTQIRGCTDSACPPFPYRPYQEAKG